MRFEEVVRKASELGIVVIDGEYIILSDRFEQVFFESFDKLSNYGELQGKTPREILITVASYSIIKFLGNIDKKTLTELTGLVTLIVRNIIKKTAQQL